MKTVDTVPYNFLCIHFDRLKSSLVLLGLTSIFNSNFCGCENRSRKAESVIQQNDTATTGTHL